MVAPAARSTIAHAARAGTASGLNDVLLVTAAFAATAAIAGFAFGRDPAKQPPPPHPAGKLVPQPDPYQQPAQRPAGPGTTAP